MIRGVHHTAISTPDLERAIAFYKDAFGFEVTMDWAWDKGTPNMDATHVAETAGRVVMIERDGTRLELFEYTAPEPRRADAEPTNWDHGICHLAVEVKDIESEVKRLEGLGMPFKSSPIEAGGVKCCYGRDPDGNLIEIIEYPGS